MAVGPAVNNQNLCPLGMEKMTALFLPGRYSPAGWYPNYPEGGNHSFAKASPIPMGLCRTWREATQLYHRKTDKSGQSGEQRDRPFGKHCPASARAWPSLLEGACLPTELAEPECAKSQV